MTNQGLHTTCRFLTSFTRLAAALLIVFALMVIAAPVAPAQTLTVLHNFAGGQDGAKPVAGLTIDSAGNLYGTAESGGAGYGTVFELKRTNSGFLFRPLYSFAGGSDGDSPEAKVVKGPNGGLYGTTSSGGIACGGFPNGCGTVFNLKPPVTACKTAICPWVETVLYRFMGGAFLDGAIPLSEVTFDQKGNLYGTTYYDGVFGEGSVFELAPSSGGWAESLPYSFSGRGDGRQPAAGVIFDQSGNLYGTARFGGGAGGGTAYQLTPASGQSWTETTLYTFQGKADGGWPETSLIMDSAGNLYGTTPWFPDTNNPGTVYQLTPSGGSWTYNLLYTFPAGYQGAGSVSSLVMDKDGNLYGTTSSEGHVSATCPYGCGTVFKLTPSGGGWTYTDLHDFTGGSDGGAPFSDVVFDSKGNLYGTTWIGGTGTNCYNGSLVGCGVVWELTP